MHEVRNSLFTRLYEALPSWPPVVALIFGTALAVTAMDEDIGGRPDGAPPKAPPEQPKGPKTPAKPPAKPRVGAHEVPYAPAPGRDDRTPLAYLSHVFALDDPALPAKLNGIGPVFWPHGGRGSGALISPTLVLTTAHLFVKNGVWHGANGAVPVPPAASEGFIYLAACGERYKFSKIEVGSEAPRSRLGLDYAIAMLDRPACPEASILPVTPTPDDLADAERDAAIIVNMGVYGFASTPRYAGHPLFTSRKPRSDALHQQAVFGVRCAVTGYDDTGDVAQGSTGLIITEGCDGVPGGSGGPLLLSTDGGATYSIIGVANSYRPNTEYNNYTRIEGAFAAHLGRHLPLTGATRAAGAPSDDGSGSPVLVGEGEWRAMEFEGPIPRSGSRAVRHSPSGHHDGRAKR